jgi:hypothetical protein
MIVFHGMYVVKKFRFIFKFNILLILDNLWCKYMTYKIYTLHNFLKLDLFLFKFQRALSKMVIRKKATTASSQKIKIATTRAFQNVILQSTSSWKFWRIKNKNMVCILQFTGVKYCLFQNNAWKLFGNFKKHNKPSFYFIPIHLAIENN